MHRILIFLFSVVALGLTSQANAGSVRTAFDLSQTSVDVASAIGLIQIPPGATITGSFVTLAPSAGSGLTSAVNGPGAITSVALHVDLNINQLGVNITGTVDADAGDAVAGWSYGNFTVSGSDGVARSPVFDVDGDPLTDPVGTLILRTETHMDCSGLFCGLAGNFPVDETMTEPNTKSATVNVHNIVTVGAASITGTLSLDIATESATESIPAVVRLVGTEISREVPEPGSMALLVAGVAGLSALAGASGIAGTRRRR